MKIKVKNQPIPQHQSHRIPAPSKREGFISKFIRIVLNDARLKLTQFKYRFVSSQEDRQKWEDYDRFCRLSRGEK